MLNTKPLLRKVPQITVFFWIIKLLTTAFGESMSDYLVGAYNPYVVVLLGFIAFAAVLMVQFRAQQYVPWVYWTAIVMVAVFGTMTADIVHVGFGVPYVVSTIVFGVVLAAVFWGWFRVEKTLSIHSIVTTRREIFYWAAVLATFALGTAAGDLLAYSAHLGFLTAGLVFACIFALPAIGYKVLGLNAILSFWFAYIMTRPLGASFADWAGKARLAGGLGLGDGAVAVVLGAFIVVLVGYLQLTHKDVDTSSMTTGRARS